MPGLSTCSMRGRANIGNRATAGLGRIFLHSAGQLRHCVGATGTYPQPQEPRAGGGSKHHLMLSGAPYWRQTIHVARPMWVHEWGETEVRFR